MLQFIVSGNTIELSDNSKIGVTYQANSLGELQNRQGNFSNIFKVPLTKNNILHLQFVHNLQSATLIPYQKTYGTLIDDGIEIVSDGEVTILNSDLKFAYVSLVGGNLDLANAIGEKTVGSLFVNDTVYRWQKAFALASNDYPWAYYFNYPLIDWRVESDTFFSSNPNIDVRFMLPTAKMTAIFERLSAFIGYEFTGNYLNSVDHQEMNLTPDYFELNPSDIISTKTNNSGYNTDQISQLELVGTGTGESEYYHFPTFNTLGGSDSEFSTGWYQPTENRIGKLSIVGQFVLNYLPYDYGSNNTPWNDSDDDHPNYQFVLRIKDNNSAIIGEDTIEYQRIEPSQSYPGESFNNLNTYVFDVETDEREFEVGHYYNVELVARVEKSEHYKARISFSDLVPHPLMNGVTGNIPENMKTFSFTPSKKIAFNNLLPFTSLFRMKVKDVLKDILNLRAIVIQTNNYTKKVFFSNFSELLDNIPYAKDWSSKVDVRSLNLSYQFGGYSQKNWCRFKENSEVTPFLGDHFFSVGNENLETESDSIKLNHCATEQQSRYLGYNITDIKGLTNSKEWKNPTYRILQVTKKSTNFNVEYSDGIGIDYRNSNIPFAKFYGFELLLPNFYESLIGMLDKTKVIQLNVFLTPVEIAELNFMIPIYFFLPEIGVHGNFYINKIDNYKKGLTRCEFIRL